MPDQQDRCILLLDPDGSLRRILGSLVPEEAARVAVAADLSSSLSLLPGADLALCAAVPGPAVDAVAAWRAAAPDMPVLVLAGDIRLDDAVALMRAGADDLVCMATLDAGGLRARLASLRELHAQRLAARTLQARQAAMLQALHEDEEAGRRVQQRILPATPQDFGWCQVAQRVVPSLYLSGDFVDYFPVGERALAFYLADVSGHGASSAFVTLLLKTLGNRARRELQRDPANLRRPSLLLDLVNRELLALGLGKHVTMLAGIIDADARQLHFAVGGQYPQIIVYDGKCARYVSGTGMPVGLFDEALYEDRIHALPAGFSLVLVSDGVFELMGSAPLADKETRLLDIVGSGALDVDALCQALALDGTREIPDDVALLVIREAAADTGA